MLTIQFESFNMLYGLQIVALKSNLKRLPLCERLSWLNSLLMLKERDLSPLPFPSFPFPSHPIKVPAPLLHTHTAPFHILIRVISPAGNHWLCCWTVIGLCHCQVSWPGSQRLQRRRKLAQGNPQYCHLPPLGAAGCHIGTFSARDLQPQVLLMVF